MTTRAASRGKQRAEVSGSYICNLYRDVLSAAQFTPCVCLLTECLRGERQGGRGEIFGQFASSTLHVWYKLLYKCNVEECSIAAMWSPEKSFITTLILVLAIYGIAMAANCLYFPYCHGKSEELLGDFYREKNEIHNLVQQV